jgi:hypothetical protein
VFSFSQASFIIDKPYKDRMTRKGSNSMPPTILKITASVKPIILNGIRMIQKKMNRKNNPMAKGQLNVKSMNQSSIAIIVFIELPFSSRHQQSGLTYIQL